MIDRIKIRNFRGIDFCEATFQNGMLIFVGQNDVGKSSVLHALRIFFEDEVKINKLDFPTYNSDLQIEIELEFKTDLFPELTQEGRIKVKQVYKLEEEKIKPPEKRIFKEVHKPTENELRSCTYTKLKKYGPIVGIEIPPNKPDDEEVERLREATIAAYQKKPDWDWEEEKKLWSQIEKALFPEIVFIPAAQDHDNEQKLTSESSLFGKLFRVGIRKWLKVDESSKDALLTIEKKVEEINEKIIRIVEEKLKEQVPLAEDLDHELASIDVSRGFTFTMHIKDEQGIKTPLNQRGSGLQRAVLIAAIRAQSEIDRLIESMGSPDEEIEDRERMTLYLVEEPEAFLHLRAQKELFYSLRDLVKSGRSQVIITSHSTLFMDNSEVEDIVLLEREEGKTISLQHIPDDEIQEELGELIRVSDVLTTKACCLVEGPSDKSAFQRWMRNLGYDYKKIGVHFISMDGCKNTQYYANSDILVAYHVPFLIVLDTDTHSKDRSKKIKKEIERKHSYIKRTNRVIILSGELENFFALDAVSEVLNLPKEYIDIERYKEDPKEELKRASEEARKSGYDVKTYKENQDAKEIASRMSREEILEQEEIREIIHRLVKMSDESIIE